MRGVPLRIEIGPKDVEKDSVSFARRDILGATGKSIESQDQLSPRVKDKTRSYSIGALRSGNKIPEGKHPHPF